MSLGATSRLAAEWVRDEPERAWRTVDGSLVLADLSGFTRLTEALEGRGREGAEILHAVVERCFEALLRPGLDLGGDVLGFAGDAALVLFSGPDHELRAAAAGAAMPGCLAAVPASVTGGRRLRASVGVGSGEILAVLAGSTRRAVFVLGPAVWSVAALQRDAAPGQVLVGEGVAAAVPSTWLRPAADGGWELRARRGRRAPGAPAPSDAPPAPDSLLATSVREVLAGASHTGDHRAASMAFVEVLDLDELLAGGGPAAVQQRLTEVADLVADIGEELGVTWLDVDVGPGSVRLLLSAGAPLAVDDDEGRLVTAVHRILANAPGPLRAGAERGRVFAATLGVPERRTFTVLGDAVNVAARALGKAGPGELVAGAGLGLAHRPGVHAEPLGRVPLRNRVEPAELWRVADVDEALVRSRRARVGGPASPWAWDRVASAWKRAIDGEGSLIAVVGEPGMGGSGLLAAAVEEAGDASVLVLAEAYRRQVPYAAVRSLVEQLAQRRGDAAWRWLERHAGHQVRSSGGLPYARAALLGGTPPDDHDVVATARRTREALVQLLAAAAPAPWLLAVDGFDLVDDASQEVFRGLGQEVSERSWLLLTSSSPGGAVPTPHPWARLVLEPLDDDEATQLVTDLQPRLRDDQIDAIVRAAQGNPFVLAELARTPSSTALPDSLERLATQRIDSLPASTRVLVREAAVLGSVVHLPVVAAVLERPALADRSSWADATSVLRPVGEEVLAFRHEAYRRAAAEALPYRRRRELHARMVEHLRASGGDLGELARHEEAAGRTEVAYQLLATAGRNALAAGAAVEAADLLARAVRLGRSGRDPGVADLLPDLAQAQVLVGDLEAADRTLKASARMHTGLGRAQSLDRRADLALRRGQFGRARQLARQGLALVPDPGGDDEAEVAGRLLLGEAAALHYLGRNDASERLAHQALALAREHGNRSLEGVAHLHLEMVLSVQLDPLAEVHGDEAIACFEETGQERSLGDALVNTGLTAMHAGRWDDALQRYQRAAEVLARTGDRWGVAAVELNTGFLLLRQGRLDDADRLGVRVVRAFDSHGAESMAAYGRHLRARVAAEEGRFAEASTLMAEARAAFERLHDEAMVIDCDVATMAQHVLAGDAASALALAREVERRLADADETVQVAFEVVLGEAMAAGGDPVGGAERAARGLALARERRLPYERMLALQVLVRIADAGGPAVPPAARDELREVEAALGLVAQIARPRRADAVATPAGGSWSTREDTWGPRSPG